MIREPFSKVRYGILFPHNELICLYALLIERDVVISFLYRKSFGSISLGENFSDIDP